MVVFSGGIQPLSMFQVNLVKLVFLKFHRGQGIEAIRRICAPSSIMTGRCVDDCLGSFWAYYVILLEAAICSQMRRNIDIHSRPYDVQLKVNRFLVSNTRCNCSISTYLILLLFIATIVITHIFSGMELLFNNWDCS